MTVGGRGRGGLRPRRNPGRAACMGDWLSLLAWGDSGWGDEMVRGALWTLLLATVSFLLGVLIGSLGAAAKLSFLPPLRWLGQGYTTLIRGVPDLDRKSTRLNSSH